MTQQIEEAPAEQSGFLRAIRLFIAVTLAIFTVGIVVGFGAATAESGVIKWKGVAIVAAAVLVLGSISFWLFRKGIAGEWLPRSPRQRTNRLVIYGTIAVGMVAGMLLQLGEQKAGGTVNFLPYDVPLHPAVAIGLLAGMPLLAWLYYRWHQSADEHDLAAYNFGGMLSLYAFFFLSICWWIAWRGGLTVEPQGYAIFWTVIIVWGAGWMWRRYR